MEKYQISVPDTVNWSRILRELGLDNVSYSEGTLVIGHVFDTNSLALFLGAVEDSETADRIFEHVRTHQKMLVYQCEEKTLFEWMLRLLAERKTHPLIIEALQDDPALFLKNFLEDSEGVDFGLRARKAICLLVERFPFLNQNENGNLLWSILFLVGHFHIDEAVDHVKTLLGDRTSMRLEFEGLSLYHQTLSVMGGLAPREAEPIFSREINNPAHAALCYDVLCSISLSNAERYFVEAALATVRKRDDSALLSVCDSLIDKAAGQGTTWLKKRFDDIVVAKSVERQKVFTTLVVRIRDTEGIARLRRAYFRPTLPVDIPRWEYFLRLSHPSDNLRESQYVVIDANLEKSIETIIPVEEMFPQPQLVDIAQLVECLHLL